MNHSKIPGFTKFGIFLPLVLISIILQGKSLLLSIVKVYRVKSEAEKSEM